MSYSATTKEQQYELQLTSTLVFNAVFSLAVFIIFPIGHRLSPAIYAPQQHLHHKNTGKGGFFFWFIDVFQQPLSVFATRGNFATMYQSQPIDDKNHQKTLQRDRDDDKLQRHICVDAIALEWIIQITVRYMQIHIIYMLIYQFTHAFVNKYTVFQQLYYKRQYYTFKDVK
ncbi:Transmembrane_domain-containing protein [Hexamita inflata]|uniref:Transmembrane_domain-containing protein n=1 Tax=Hexamita inflata TaxID=28002 RepID=A0ABP1JUD5_9EUKA